MKVAICSDLHLEFGDLQLNNDQNVDVLILSGDICVTKDIGRPDPHNFMEGARSNRIQDFFKRCSFQFPRVIYIMGNHEHYHGDVAESANKIRSMLESNMLSNVHFLDKEFIDIDGIRFIGGTLWTDFNGEDEMTMNHVTRRMNDFQVCENSNEMVTYRTYEPSETSATGSKTKFRKRPSTWSPQSALVEHKAMKKFIEDNYDPTRVNVVCTHHAPSKGSEHPRYKHDTLMNGAYNSQLDNFIMERPMIKLWTHGHTHEDFDYMIKSCRVVCNPRGYINYEERADRFQLKVVEV
jgi:Icc-related predicted phosphoesterase